MSLEAEVAPYLLHLLLFAHLHHFLLVLPVLLFRVSLNVNWSILLLLFLLLNFFLFLLLFFFSLLHLDFFGLFELKVGVDLAGNVGGVPDYLSTSYRVEGFLFIEIELLVLVGLHRLVVFILMLLSEFPLLLTLVDLLGVLTQHLLGDGLLFNEVGRFHFHQAEGGRVG